VKKESKATEGAHEAVMSPFIVSRQAAGSENGSSHPHAEKQALRIVLVEDSENDVELIRHALLDAGLVLSMVTVQHPELFQAELARPPDIILSDYVLPQFDGATALQLAKQNAPEVPFIFVTGGVGEEVVIEMLKQGATDYVLKNRLARLGPAVNRALREADQRRENQRAQERLRRSHDQLRALTGHLQFVREEERTRIAREVHDELGQALTGLKIDLSWLSGRIARERALQRKAKEMSAQIDATIHTVRRIATELRPGVLDSLGLAAAIEWQTMDFQERTGIKCDVKIDVKDTDLDREFSTVCFRIFQETLTNIIRHAKANHVDVHLVQVDQELILTVRDNGRGISEKEVIHARSIGLIGMRERVAQVGGEVFFFGLPSRGTTVTMRVPIPQGTVRREG
jgi:signal transduction histidine kinase